MHNWHCVHNWYCVDGTNDIECRVGILEYKEGARAGDRLLQGSILRYIGISIPIKYSNFSGFYKKLGPFYKKLRCDKFGN